MNVVRTEFVEEDILFKTMGAGVVPYARCPDGMLYVLLGRERWASTWRGSCKWSGFEGSRKIFETPAEAAVREFTEESMGVVMNGDDLATKFEQDDFFKRIVLRIVHNRRATRYHCTYVIRIDWDPSLPDTFQLLKNRVEQLDRLNQEWKMIRPPGYCIRDEIGQVLACENGTVHVQKKSNVGIVQYPWVLQSDGIMRATFSDLNATMWIRWEQLRMRVQCSLVHHSCVHIQRGKTWGNIVNIVVCRDYLEKDILRWWKVSELKSVFLQKGVIGIDRFRPYFLPVLQLILDEFDENEKPDSEQPVSSVSQ